MAPAQTIPHMLRLRVSIDGSDPQIWREIELGGWVTLAGLHHILQVTFGWQESHLHRFSEQDPWAVRRGIPRIGSEPRSWVDQWSLMEQDLGEHDEADATIIDAFSRGGPIWYEYDMGDGWMHRIELISSRPAEPTDTTVSILDGARRAPFEDSGGIGGYAEKLAIIADPRHPEHEEITAWARFVAGPWGTIDPDDADLDGARSELALLVGEPTTDMSGLVDPQRDIEADAPIVDFASNLPVPYRANLRRHVRATGVLEPETIDDETAAELMRPYLWLLDRIGDDGLALTQAGWMRPADVSAAVDELGWRDAWFGKGNREEHARPVADLRASATSLRLIRKVKGRLELVARTRKIASDPQALCTQVAHMLLRQRLDDARKVACTVFVLGIADGTMSTTDDSAGPVVDIVNGFGYRDQHGMPLDDLWFYALTEPVRSVLTTMGMWPHLGFAHDTPSDGVRAFARLALR